MSWLTCFCRLLWRRAHVSPDWKMGVEDAMVGAGRCLKREVEGEGWKHQFIGDEKL
jgi:hypothetical protein